MKRKSHRGMRGLKNKFNVIAK